MRLWRRRGGKFAGRSADLFERQKDIDRAFAKAEHIGRSGLNTLSNMLISMDPDSPPYRRHCAQGDFHADRGEFREAIDFYALALDTAPESCPSADKARICVRLANIASESPADTVDISADLLTKSLTWWELDAELPYRSPHSRALEIQEISDRLLEAGRAEAAARAHEIAKRGAIRTGAPTLDITLNSLTLLRDMALKKAGAERQG